MIGNDRVGGSEPLSIAFGSVSRIFDVKKCLKMPRVKYRGTNLSQAVSTEIRLFQLQMPR